MEVMSDNYSRVGPRIAKRLLDSGSDVNAVDELGFTALMCAAIRGSRESVELLLDAGGDANMTDDDGMTALMWAARSQNRDSLEGLLKAGVILTVKDKQGRTAFDHAPNKCRKIRELLKPNR